MSTLTEIHFCFKCFLRKAPGLPLGMSIRMGRRTFLLATARIRFLALYIQNQAGDFKETNQPAFQKDKGAEDSCSELFDADQDGDLDLYVCSGGNEFPANAPELSDRLYLNDGKGNFTRSPRALPPNIYENDSCVKSSDFDGDGDNDLFIGVTGKTFSIWCTCERIFVKE